MPRPKSKVVASRQDPEFRVKVIKTALEKELSPKEVSKVFGVGLSTISKWKKVFREKGEEGLRGLGRRRHRARKQLHPVLQEKLRTQALETKRKFPFFGVLRVWQWLLRTSFLPVSFRQVRQTMAEANLIEKVVKKKRKPRQPRRFERATPNDLWATDITNIILAGGQTVFMIAFIDDHSRYIVSWGVYASCVSELVLEVLRRGISTYGKPKDILSDHGPQYWVRRGKTLFQKFLQREDINHIRAGSAQGNGKIEAFWGSLKKEWYDRSKRKGDLEEVRDRISHWLAFYNWQRPHEEIDCAPAERYFQYQAAMKAEIQKRIRANEEELSLSPTPPSAIVGHTPLGDEKFEVRKEGDEIVARLGDQEISRRNVHTRKEKTNEAQEGTDGVDGDRGRGGEGQSVAGPGSPVRGENHLPGVQGDGAQTPLVLQNGGADGGGDARRGQDAGSSGQAQEPDGGGSVAHRPDGGTPPGAPQNQEPGPDHQETLPPGEPENAEKRPREAERTDSDATVGGAGSDGAAPSGPSAGAGEGASVTP